MNERELDRAKVETYKRVVTFARDAVEKEKNALEVKIKELENEIRELRKKGISLDSALTIQLKDGLLRCKKMLKKSQNDLNYLNNILNHIDTGITNSIDPDLKIELLNDLANKKQDLLVSNTDQSRKNRIQRINNEIDSVINTYDSLILNTTSVEKKEKLRKEQSEKIKKLENRINKIKEYQLIFEKYEKDIKKNNPSFNQTDVQRALDNNIIRFIDDEKNKIEQQISNIQMKPEKTSEEQLQDTILLVKPLFTKYKNEYGAFTTNVKVKNGETTFNYIMKTTDTYSKMKDDIDRMENILATINATNISKGKPIYDTNQVLKGEMTYYQELPYRIESMKKKQTMIDKKQKIVLLKRQEIIDKRNYKISALESKSTQLNNSGKTTTRIDKKIEKLSKKPIKLQSANRILFIEKLKVSWSHKATNEDGNIDKRTWEEEAYDNLINKGSGKTL